MYPLNVFPKHFGEHIGKNIVYLLATRPDARIEGPDWEEMFAECVGATWKPSNIGLDDIVSGATAWGAKTVKNVDPFGVKRVRLISGRNSLQYSYGTKNLEGMSPAKAGKDVLGIWNKRVSEVRERFETLRTVVLIKADDLCRVAVFEFETVRYEPSAYDWRWNGRGNLEGHDRESGDHRFTWQPHGSQFTVVEDVPVNRLRIEIRRPRLVRREAILDAVGYSANWVKIVGPTS